MSASFFAQTFSVVDFLKALARSGLGLLREAPVHAERILQRGRGPRVVFLPAYGPTGAALLRIYAIATALRPLGWQTLVLPPKLTLAQRQRLLAWLGPDVVVLQGARHPFNRPHFFPGHRIVYDMDDADFHLPHLASAVEQTVPDVTTVIAGSRYVADWCRNAGAPSAHVVWTGSPVSDHARAPQHVRPPVIAWAQSRPMTYTGEAEWVRSVITGIASQHPGVTLRLYDRRPDDDQSFLNMFQAPGVHVEWMPYGSYRDYLSSFDDVALGLAPLNQKNAFSRGKSFGKVLAYLDARVPVIASAAGEHGAFFTDRTGVVSNDVDVWIETACRLLSDSAAREAMAQAAFDEYVRHLSREAAAAKVDVILRSLVGSQKNLP